MGKARWRLAVVSLKHAGSGWQATVSLSLPLRVEEVGCAGTSGSRELGACMEQVRLVGWNQASRLGAERAGAY